MENKLKEESGGVKKILLLSLSIFFAFLTFLVLVFTLSQIKQWGYIGQEILTKNTITISGQGEIFTKPDLAIVSFSVISEAKDVQVAISENTEKMNNIINFMKKNKVEDRDLKTIAFRVNPRYEWHDNEKNNRIRRGKRVLVGYEVRQSLEVKIRDMEKIGTIVQGGVDFGANQVGSLQFTIDNKKKFKVQAREQAIIEAKEKARVLASQLGIELVRIVNFSEAGQQRISQFKRGVVFEEMAAPTFDSLMPEVEVGENKIQAIVYITYEIR